MRTRPSIARRCLAVASTIAVAAHVVPVSVAYGEPAAQGDRKGAKAAILPLSVRGELPETDRKALTERVVEGLQRGEFDVATPDDVASAVPDAASCSEPECIKDVAEATGATHVVRAVVIVEDRDYTVQLDLFDATTGTSIANAGDGCEICGVVDAGNLLDTAAATLKLKLDALAQGPATLSVASVPAGAQVAVDGQLLGTTPFSSPVIAGKHVLRVSKDGYITVEREVTFVEGVEETASFELEKTPSKLPSRRWGWVSLGLGLAGIGTAVAFTAIDDRSIKTGGACDGGNVDDAGNCRRLWDADWIMFSTAIAGAALTTLGIAILIDSSVRERKAKGAGKADKPKKTARLRRRPQIGVGAASVLVTGRF